jgi:hypothetical protein
MNLEVQSKCSIEYVISFLDKLKENGMYDNSVIILQADHGAGLSMSIEQSGDSKAGIAASASPLLVIKPISSEGKMEISTAPSALTDIPTTICAALNLQSPFGGENIFALGEKKKRDREFYYYVWKHKNWQNEYFVSMDKYIISGNVLDLNSWEFVDTIWSPKVNINSYTDEILFGTDESEKFLHNGWGDNEIYPKDNFPFNWALGDSASIFAKLPTDKVRMVAEIKPLPFNPPQEIDITIDGEKVGTWKPSNDWKIEQHSILIPKNNHRPDMSNIEFKFSQHRSPEPQKADQRPLTVIFKKITFQPMDK